MRSQISKFGVRKTVAVGAAAAFAAGLLAFAAPASAGGERLQSASAMADCIDGEGEIEVVIFDNFSTDYDVFLRQGDVVVDSDLNRQDTDEGGDPIFFGPLADGVYTVQVLELTTARLPFDFIEDVTVDCVPDVPVTDPAPTVPETTPAPVAAAATASPRFTG